LLKTNVNKIGKKNIISIDESSFDTHINAYYGWSVKRSSNNGDKTKIKNTVNCVRPIKVFIYGQCKEIHHSKIFKAYAETINNKILYNVPYMSELNPIEMVFSKVKSIVHKRNNNSDAKKLCKNIKYGFKKITKSNLRGYYKKALSF
jgi:nitrogenase subunit NifH